MTTDQVSYNPNEDKVKDDLESISQEEGEGVVTEDGEYSISMRSDVGPPYRRLSTRQKAAEDERATLAKQESKAISFLRGIVLVVLIVVGATFAYLVFFFTEREQEGRFKNEFVYYAQQVIDSFNGQLEGVLEASDTLSTDITSYALVTESKFPFVTLPDVELKGCVRDIPSRSTTCRTSQRNKEFHGRRMQRRIANIIQLPIHRKRSPRPTKTSCSERNGTKSMVLPRISRRLWRHLLIRLIRRKYGTFRRQTTQLR